MNTKEWLVVDLDQSLLRTDLFVEGLLRAVLTRPLKLLAWLFASRFKLAGLKQLVAQHIAVRYENLPYNKDVLGLIERAREAGKLVLLATGADIRHAEGVSEHLGVFDRIIASDGHTNLKGNTKLLGILELLNEAPFEYVGDSSSDKPMFLATERAFLVNPSRKLKQWCVNNQVNHVVVCENKLNIWRYDSRILRPHQWLKNIVFFVPAVTGFGLYDLKNLWLVLPTFSLMSLVASVVYILNDIADIESDRMHTKKRKRAFASGEIPILFGFIVGIGVFIFAAAILYFWRPTTTPLFIGYFFMTVAYTMIVKEIAIIDILMLVCFYVVRVLIGIETLEMRWSIWLISFCFLMFTNLAFIKRFIEVNESNGGVNPRRRYNSTDKDFLRTSGLAALFGSIVLLLLYTKSEDFSSYYVREDIFAMLSIPYGVMMLRMWYMANRGQVDSDPLVYVIRSPFSYGAVLICCAILYLSR